MCNLGRPFCTSGNLAGAIWDVPFAHQGDGLLGGVMKS